MRCEHGDRAAGDLRPDAVGAARQDDRHARAQHEAGGVGVGEERQQFGEDVARLQVWRQQDVRVAGDPDILIAPDLEAGNILAKQLTFLANADSAGLVLGARVPIILTSRADSLLTRLASCAVAVLVVAARRAKAAVTV